MHKINYIFAALAIITMTFISCQKDNEEDDIDVIIREYVGNYTITVGNTLSLDMAFFIQEVDTSYNEIAYTSNNPQIASVTDGVVTGLKAGKTSIAVSIYQKGKQSPHHIYKYEITVNDIIREHIRYYTMKVGEVLSLDMASFIQEIDTSCNEIVYTSNDSLIASVTNGTVTGLKVGRTSIAVSIYQRGNNSPHHIYEYEIIVVDKKEDVKDFTIFLPKQEYFVGDTAKIQYYINDSDTIDEKDILWDTTNPEIAIIKDGIIKFINEGNCTIIAFINDISLATKYQIVGYQVNVSSIKRLKDIKVESSNIIGIGQTDQIFVHAIPSTVELPQLKWKSLTPDIVSVDQNGIVKGISKGYGSIMIETMDGAISKTILIIVEDSTSIVNVTDFIYISNTSSAIINVGGYRKGSVSTTIRNASNVDVVLKKFEVIDNSTNRLIAYTEDESQLGILHPAEERTLGVNQITIAPNTTLSFIWTGMYNDREFQVIGYY